MSNPLVSNSYLSSNPDFKVKARDDGSGNLIQAVDIAASTDTAFSGSISANGTTNITLPGGTATVTIALTQGTMNSAANFSFYNTNDGVPTTFVSVEAWVEPFSSALSVIGSAGQTIVNLTTQPMTCRVVGMTHFQILVSAWTSGTATYRINCSQESAQFVCTQFGKPRIPADSIIPTRAPDVYAHGSVFDGSFQNRTLQVTSTLNAVATGIAASGLVGQFDDTFTTTLSENRFGVGRLSTNRNLYTTLRDAAGNERGVNVTSANALTVDGSAVTQPTTDSQTITDNNAFTDGTSKVFPTGYVFDEVAGTALTENDIAAARVDSKRAQVLVLEDGTTRGRRAIVTSNGALSTDLLTIAGTGVTVNATIPGIQVTTPSDRNGSTFISHFWGMNTAAAGIQAVGLVAEVNESGATPITIVSEANRGNLRMSPNRSLYGQIRDAAGNERGVNVSAANALKVDTVSVTQGTPTQTTVAASASSVTLKTATTGRIKIVIVNDSTSATLYIRMNASAATNANYTYRLYPGSTLEEFNYTGEIRGIWTAASGNARVTDYA